MLIGIIVGGIALIAGIVLIVYCIYKKKCKTPINNDSDVLTIKTFGKGPTESEGPFAKPTIFDNSNKKLFKFQTGTGITKDVYIEPDKKIKDLIKLYFNQIKQPELFNDADVIILAAGKKIDKKLDKLISEFCEENITVPIPVFVVIDTKSKIKNL